MELGRKGRRENLSQRQPFWELVFFLYIYFTFRFLFCVYECLPTCMSGAHIAQKRVSDILELRFLMVEDCELPCGC